MDGGRGPTTVEGLLTRWAAGVGPRWGRAPNNDKRPAPETIRRGARDKPLARWCYSDASTFSAGLDSWTFQRFIFL